VFRRRHLVPALREGEQARVNLNGTLGYGSSFLEEAFGGLVRLEGFLAADLRRRLKIESDDQFLVQEIWSYIDEAVAEESPSQEGANPAHP
jgi:hypothetical protein